MCKSEAKFYPLWVHSLEVFVTWVPSIVITTCLAFNRTNVWACSSPPYFPPSNFLKLLSLVSNRPCMHVSGLDFNNLVGLLRRGVVVTCLVLATLLSSVFFLHEHLGSNSLHVDYKIGSQWLSILVGFSFISLKRFSMVISNMSCLWFVKLTSMSSFGEPLITWWGEGFNVVNAWNRKVASGVKTILWF